MYFAFIDESGKPLADAQDQRPILNAVCIKDSDIKRITQALYSIENSCFGASAGEKRQLKGNKMTHPRSMKPEYNYRKEYVEKVVRLFESFDLYVFAVVMEKPDFNPYQKKGLLPKQYRYLLDRLNSFGIYQNTQILLVYDKIDDKDDGFIAEGIKSFLFTHGVGKHFDNIIHMPLFVSSINNPLIRFPDMSSNIFRHFYNQQLDQNLDVYEQWIKSLKEIIESKTLNLKNLQGNYDYGIYHMRKQLFPAKENEL